MDSPPYLVGPQFSDVGPKSAAGALSPTVYTIVPNSATSLTQGTITQVTPYSSFVEGQDIIFWLDVTGRQGSGQNPGYVNFIRLKLWWLRPAVEFRTPGDPAMGGWLGGAAGPPPQQGTIDGTTYGGITDVNNRGVWIPETRGIMIVPPTSPDRNVEFDHHDVIWTIRLQDPTVDLINGTHRRIVFAWKAFGRALGFTGDYTFTNASDPGTPSIGVSYKTGWAGGSQIAGNAVL